MKNTTIVAILTAVKAQLWDALAWQPVDELVPC